MSNTKCVAKNTNECMKKSNLVLKNQPTLADFQNYVKQMELERGFSEQGVLQKCLMLGEEIGELFKAVRKETKIKIDHNSEFGTVSNELADIIIYICAIANRFDIDLETALRQKEEINKKREWK